MSKQNSLSTRLKPASADILNIPKPSTTQKRKRTTTTTAPVDSESEDNYTKKQKTTKKTPAAKKPLTKRAPTKKALEGKKEAEHLYKKTIEDVNKKVGGLDARVKKMGPNSSAVTSDDYAKIMCKFIKDVKKLMVMGPEGARCAFNLILYIGPTRAW